MDIIEDFTEFVKRINECNQTKINKMKMLSKALQKTSLWETDCINQVKLWCLQDNGVTAENLTEKVESYILNYIATLPGDTYTMRNMAERLTDEIVKELQTMYEDED